MFVTVNTKKGGLKGERVRSQPIRPQIKFPRGILDQVISNPEARTAAGACTWSGPQASSPKLQASSSKPEVTSSLILDPRNMDIGEVLEEQGPRVFAKINVLLG